MTFSMFSHRMYPSGSIASRADQYSNWVPSEFSSTRRIASNGDRPRFRGVLDETNDIEHSVPTKPAMWPGSA
jgi:hypothetical protein